MNKYIWIVISIITGVLVLTGYFLTSNKTNYAPQEESFKKDVLCKEYFYNKDATVRIVFFANQETTEKYANYLLAASPYNEHRTDISIFYVDEYVPKCTTFKDIAVYCKSSEMENIADKCTAEYIVAFDNKPISIRSSTYGNIVSLNSNHPLNVLLHEFAHAFGKLEDEYVPAKLTSKNKNCVAQCDLFGDAAEGCYQGCSTGEYYRSIENGIMRSLRVDEYGKYNEELIEKQFS